MNCLVSSLSCDRTLASHSPVFFAATSPYVAEGGATFCLVDTTSIERRNFWCSLKQEKCRFLLVPRCSNLLAGRDDLLRTYLLSVGVFVMGTTSSMYAGGGELLLLLLLLFLLLLLYCSCCFYCSSFVVVVDPET